MLIKWLCSLAAVPALKVPGVHWCSRAWPLPGKRGIPDAFKIGSCLDGITEVCERFLDARDGYSPYGSQRPRDGPVQTRDFAAITVPRARWPSTCWTELVNAAHHESGPGGTSPVDSGRPLPGGARGRFGGPSPQPHSNAVGSQSDGDPEPDYLSRRARYRAGPGGNSVSRRRFQPTIRSRSRRWKWGRVRVITQ
jgi:hypothetical protein